MMRRHPRMQRAIYRTIFGGASPRRMRRIYAHLKGCEACRSFYDRVVDLETSLRHPSAASLEEEQLKRVENALGLGSTRPREFRAWLTLVPAVVMAGVVAVVIATGALQPAVDGLRERGLLPGPLRGARLNVYCFSSRQEEQPVRKLRPPALLAFRSPGNRCNLEDRLGFEVSLGENPPPYVFVFGVDERLEPLWYHPLPREGQSVSLQRNADVKMLPGMVELRKNHHEGSLHVYALYSKRALSWQEVAGAVEIARRNHATLETVRIDLPDVVAQERLILKLEPTHAD